MALRNLRYLLVTLLLMLPMKFAAQDKSVYFVRREADCGVIPKEINTVSETFVLVNKSNQCIAIASCKVGCGCTTVSYDEGKIAPGDSLNVIVTVKTEHKWGNFEEDVLVRISPDNIPFILRIKGRKEYVVSQ